MMTAALTFLLSVVFFGSGLPAVAAPPSAHETVLIAEDDPRPPCRFDKPGICPYY